MERAAPTWGGRFSVLSNFGLVPAAACGVDVPAFLAPAGRMAELCGPAVPAGRNPGARLGLLLGLAAAAGRDKTTLVLSPSVRALGAWLEQLLAESTGKAGRGLIPVVDEELGPPSAYGSDRLFVHVRVEDDPDLEQDAALAVLAAAGHPVVTLPVPGREALAAEFFRWELATAVCGAVLGVNPFDQPDVEAAKVAARSLTAAWEAAGGPPDERPVAESDGIALFADAGAAARLRPAAGGSAHARTARVGACGERGPRRLSGPVGVPGSERGTTQRRCSASAAGSATPGAWRRASGSDRAISIRPAKCSRGGPATGVFVVLTTDDTARDLAVPGRSCTFGTVKMAQALGDHEVLAARGRRVGPAASGRRRRGRARTAGVARRGRGGAARGGTPRRNQDRRRRRPVGAPAGEERPEPG